MFPYDLDFDPPAPCLSITLAHPTDSTRTIGVTAQLDTGADLTAVPQAIVEPLALPDAGDLLVAWYDGSLARVPMYYLNLTVAEYTLAPFRVVAISGEQALLGRDVLNQFYTHLHGPDLTFDLARSRESE